MNKLVLFTIIAIVVNCKTSKGPPSSDLSSFDERFGEIFNLSGRKFIGNFKTVPPGLSEDKTVRNFKFNLNFIGNNNAQLEILETLKIQRKIFSFGQNKQNTSSQKKPLQIKLTRTKNNMNLFESVGKSKYSKFIIMKNPRDQKPYLHSLSVKEIDHFLEPKEGKVYTLTEQSSNSPNITGENLLRDIENMSSNEVSLLKNLAIQTRVKQLHDYNFYSGMDKKVYRAISKYYSDAYLIPGQIGAGSVELDSKKYNFIAGSLLSGTKDSFGRNIYIEYYLILPNPSILGSLPQNLPDQLFKMILLPMHQKMLELETSDEKYRLSKKDEFTKTFKIKKDSAGKILPFEYLGEINLD